MRKIILSAAVAVLAATSFAAPSQAGGYGWGHGWGHGHHKNHGGYGGGYVRVYDDYGYQPVCRFKTVKKYDRWGNVFFKEVRICR